MAHVTNEADLVGRVVLRPSQTYDTAATVRGIKEN